MMSERKSTSTKVFTVRLGLGSVIVAALITFVGLAWIFFLGVMAGRMYYGVDSTTLAQNASQNQQVAAATPPQNTTMPSKPQHGITEAPAQSKSITTYHPVIKDDKVAERVAQGQEPFPHDDFKDIATADETNVVELEAEDSSNTMSDGDTSAVDTATSATDLQNSEANLETEGPDFIEKVTIKNDSLAPSTQSTTPNTVAVDEQASTAEMSQDTPPALSTQPENTYAVSTEPVQKDRLENSTTSEATTSIQEKSTSTNQQIFDYTYQLATFKNPESAHSITAELVADGLNAAVLTEDRNGTLFHYILVYHQGSEESKKALEKQLAQHNFTDFIVRGKVAQ